MEQKTQTTQLLAGGLRTNSPAYFDASNQNKPKHSPEPTPEQDLRKSAWCWYRQMGESTRIAVIQKRHDSKSTVDE